MARDTPLRKTKTGERGFVFRWTKNTDYNKSKYYERKSYGLFYTYSEKRNFKQTV